MRKFRLAVRGLAAFVIACALMLPHAVRAADPMRIGLSVSLTGGVAPIGKQVLAALQIWRMTSMPKAVCWDARSSWCPMTTRAIRPTCPSSTPS